MDVRIDSQGISRSAALSEFVRERLRTALARYRDAIEDVRVKLSDENGPRGGVDKRCQLQVGLRRLPPLRVTQRSDDIYQAVALAARRSDRLVARQIRRRGPSG